MNYNEETTVLLLLMRYFKGTYSKDFIFELTNYNIKRETASFLFSHFRGKFTADEVIEIIDNIETDEHILTDILKNLDGDLTSDHLEEIYDRIDESSYRFLEPYFQKLSFADKLDLKEYYSIDSEIGNDNVNDSAEIETIPWDRFYYDHCNDSTVSEMIKKNIFLSGLKDCISLVFALGDLNQEKHKMKVLIDLMQMGYRLSEELVLEYFNSEGEDDVLFFLMKNYVGDYSHKTVSEFISFGCEIRTLELILRNYKGLFSYDDVEEIVSFMDCDKGIRKSILNRIEGKLSLDQLESILLSLNESEYSLMKKYASGLSRSERAELKTFYGI